MDMDKGKFQFAGLKFLYEMELIEDPQLVNNLKLNILDVSGSIRDVELLSSYQHRQMLIYIETSWFGRKFFMRQIEAGILERVKQLLPNFRFRVTSDRKILEMSLERVRNALKGEQNESSNRTVSSVAPGAVASQPAVVASEGGTQGSPELQEKPGVLQDPQGEPERK